MGFAAVALYGPAAKYFQDQMHLGGFRRLLGARLGHRTSPGDGRAIDAKSSAYWHTCKEAMSPARITVFQLDRSGALRLHSSLPWLVPELL